MTVHASKGLEFNAVFLTGMEEGRFPSEMSLAERGGLEEERRLMYVAITRARKRLYITMAQQRMLHGQTQFGIVSRFVEEIPPEVLHYLSVKKPPTTATATHAKPPYNGTKSSTTTNSRKPTQASVSAKTSATPNSAPASSSMPWTKANPPD